MIPLHLPNSDRINHDYYCFYVYLCQNFHVKIYDNLTLGHCSLYSSISNLNLAIKNCSLNKSLNTCKKYEEKYRTMFLTSNIHKYLSFIR